VLRFAVPAGLIVAAATFSAYALARARGLPLAEQRTAATLVALILSLCVLALLALPLTWRRVALLVAALAAFVLLFPVTAVRRFYALALPHGAIAGTLFIAGLGVVALAGFWIVSRRLLSEESGLWHAIPPVHIRNGGRWCGRARQASVRSRWMQARVAAYAAVRPLS
jgi:cation-transporting ATPase E